MRAAWQITKGSKEISLGVVDSNFDERNSDLLLNGKRCSTRDYEFVRIDGGDPYQHGFSVAQTAAACTNNDFGIAGVNWYSPLIGYDPPFDGVNLAQSVALLLGVNPCKRQTDCEKLVRDVDVVNTSFGAYYNATKFSDTYFRAAEKTLPFSAKVWVAAAGNDGKSADQYFPSALPSVISVGSTNKLGGLARFSNFGRRVDILAPGEDMIHMHSKFLYSSYGTSYSAPLVAGIITLMKSVYPHEQREKYWNWKVAKYLLQKTAKPLSCKQLCPGQGYITQLVDSIFEEKAFNTAECKSIWCDYAKPPGRVDAEAAVKAAQMGLPKVPLIDTDKYLLIADNIIPHQTVSFSLQVFNRGGAKARVHVSSKHPNILIKKSSFELNSVAQTHAGTTIEIEIKTPNLGDKIGFIDIKAEGINNNDPYVDRHEVWVLF